MPKRNWLLSLLACAGLWSVALPASGQALLPYALPLDSQQFEQQGLKLAQDASQLVQLQKYELALPRAKLATQLAPNQYQPWLVLGSLYLQNQELDQGIEALQRAQNLAPNQARVLFALGSAYFQKGDYSSAIKKLRAGLKIDPNSPMALFDLGNSYLQSQRYRAATAAYKKAFAQQKDFWPAINNIGLVKYEQGDVEGAIDAWQRAIKIDNQSAEPKLALAVALYAQGKKEQGLALAKDALALDSSYADVEFLKENLWGASLIEDTKKFLATPQMQALLARLEQPSEEEETTETPSSPESN